MVQSWTPRAIKATAAAAIAKTGEVSWPCSELEGIRATEMEVAGSPSSSSAAAFTATDAPALATTEAPGFATTEAPGLATTEAPGFWATEMDAAGLAAPVVAPGAAFKLTVA